MTMAPILGPLDARGRFDPAARGGRYAQVPIGDPEDDEGGIGDEDDDEDEEDEDWDDGDDEP